MATFETGEEEVWILTAEGHEIATHGSHEVKVFNLIAPDPEGTAVADIQVSPWRVWC